MPFTSVPVYVDRHLCDQKFLRWRRPHRKKRIAKKWQRKYGAVFAPCKGVAYRLLSRIVCCPCVYATIRRSLS